MTDPGLYPAEPPFETESQPPEALPPQEPQNEGQPAELTPEQAARQKAIFSNFFRSKYGPDAVIVSPGGKYEGGPDDFAERCSEISGITAKGIFAVLMTSVTHADPEKRAAIKNIKPTTE